MKENAKVSSPVDSSARTQFAALIEQGVFRACERHVCHSLDYEERVQEGLGLTWKWYQQEIARGNNPELALIRHACNRRTVDRSHRLDSGDRRPWAQDVYHQAARNRVELRRLQLVDDVDDRVEEDANLGLAEPGCQDPTEKLDSGLDLQAWLKTLSARDRTLLAMRQSGYGLAEIGTKLKTTSSTAWKHSQELGHELAERAGVKIEKKRRQRLPRGLPPAMRDAIAVE